MVNQGHAVAAASQSEGASFEVTETVPVAGVIRQLEAVSDQWLQA